MVTRYTPADAAEWDAFLAASRQTTFLFRRAYMDYHSDRFADCSLIVRGEAGQIVAMLPANEGGGVLYSHQGLTYGGLITGPAATAAATLAIFGEINSWLRAHGFRRVVYKALPYIYSSIPAQEDLYALVQLCHARLTVREISSTIALPQAPRWSHSRRVGVGRARNNGISISRDKALLPQFWEVLTANLHDRYGAAPVHTLDEMRLLMRRFPDEIALYTAVKDGQVLGGTVIYDCGPTVHTQYISATPEGKHLGALDAIFHQVLTRDYVGRGWFDFGKSTEDEGRRLNESLIYQKEGFGGRGVCYDTYEYEL